MFEALAYLLMSCWTHENSTGHLNLLTSKEPLFECIDKKCQTLSVTNVKGSKGEVRDGLILL